MAKERRSAACPHCQRISSHRLVWTYQRWEQAPELFDAEIRERLETTLADENGELSDAFCHPSYYIAVCESCLELILYVNHPFHDDLTDSFQGALESPTEPVWPLANRVDELPESIPERIRQIYEEALQIRSRSPSSFAVQLRRALEAVAIDKGFTVGPLHRRLEEMAFRGVLPGTVNEAAGALRLIGNKGAHADEENVSSQDAMLMDSFFKLVLQYVYVVPAELAKLSNRRPSPGSATPTTQLKARSSVQ